MNKDKVLKDYLDYKKTSVHSAEKLKDLKRYINKFLNSSNKSLDKFTEIELVNFINSLSNAYKTRTINDIKAYLKNFIRWYYVDFSSRFRNLDSLCRSHKAQKPQSSKEMLTLKQVDKMIKAEKDLMWRVYWLIFFYGGMRPNETCSLLWEQIEFDKNEAFIKIFSKKNKEEFIKYIPEKATHYLRQWQKDNPTKFVFPSPLVRDSHIKPKSVYHRLKKLSKRVLGKEVYPYTLRRSIATIKYNDDNLKEDDVANQMGHTKSMKKVYVTLSDEQLKARARKVWGDLKKEYTKKEKDDIIKLKKQSDFLTRKIKEIENKLKLNREFFLRQRKEIEQQLGNK